VRWENTAIIDDDVVILQNCMDSLKVKPNSCSETCATSSNDGNQVTSMKAERISDIGEGEDPLLIKFPAIKVEHEVSCMFVCQV
jgi:hypothetical protein